MSMGWSAEALAILDSGTVNGKVTATIDVECATGLYGVSLQDVTSRVLDMGELTRATSAIDQNFNTTQIILRLQNIDGYFTPNFMSGSRDKINNIWRVRTPPSSEAHFRDCRVYIDFALKLADGTWETKRLSSGTIADLNLLDHGGPICELVVKDTMFDAFDVTLGMPDGNGGTGSIGSWTTLTWEQFLAGA